eukprot:CAMPEP_0198299694 /NCGR_PEP_ID=MMETSP1449-20131203/45599_1 /TAXON_ID=420275 /ORGANISM="Attheya septentrionalis, Strain CCMP2084" /LENGTH=331 /DNA_ID=CAMNT_0044001321 /DNA_START=96 /DNA_END=1091 /DNA_ORIENTATION=-
MKNIGSNCLGVLLLVVLSSEAFVVPVSRSVQTTAVHVPFTTLFAADDGGKKKKRRRKKDSTVLPPPATTVDAPMDNGVAPDGFEDAIDMENKPPAPVTTAKSSSSNKISGMLSNPGSMPLIDKIKDRDTEDDFDLMSGEIPDMKEMLKNMERKKEKEREAYDFEKNQAKIQRGDKAALKEMMETMGPYADMDDSIFESDGYSTVSALLGEGSKPFLGIPSGPLQVGHFIGALGIVLCAFVEYPGFPLTNLPSPLRGALQGGLGTIYFINLGMGVMAGLKASERNQSPILWAVKTFSVGAIAYDQLMQLPTTDQIEQAKARKGSRALNKPKR